MSKRPLQYITAVLSLIPLITGVITMMGVTEPLYVDANIPRNALLDSNLRFLGGVWLGLGLSLLWLVPRIDTQTVVFRIFWGMIFIGGIGRLLSMLFIGLPAAPFTIPFIGFTALEIIGAPLFILWQSRIAVK